MIMTTKHNKSAGGDKLTHLPMLRKIMKVGNNNSPSLYRNSAACVKKVKYLIDNFGYFTFDTLIYSPYKEKLVDTVNQRNSTIFQMLKENLEMLQHICALDHGRSHRAKKKEELERAQALINQYAESSNIQCVELNRDEVNKEISLNETSGLTVPGCDLSEIEWEDNTLSTFNQPASLEKLISNAVDSLDTDLENEPNAHSSNSNICNRILTGEYECEENYLCSLAYEISMIGGSDTPIITDVWLNEAANEITAPYSVIQIKQ